MESKLARAVLGSWYTSDLKLAQDHTCLLSDKNKVPVIICLW